MGRVEARAGACFLCGECGDRGAQFTPPAVQEIMPGIPEQLMELLDMHDSKELAFAALPDPATSK